MTGVAGLFYQRKDSVATLNASGNGSSVIRNDNAASILIIRQISVISVPTASGCTCTAAPPTGVIDTAYFAGTGDVFGGEPAHYLYSGDYITLTWTKGAPNGQGIATYYYDEIYT